MTPRHLALSIALLLSSPALAASSRYDAVRQQARTVDDLGPFLSRYLGDCRDEVTRNECEQNVRAVRRDVDGRMYAASIGEQTLDLVRPERTRGGYRFFVTPFIDGGGVALTNGAPRQQDAAGRPLIGLMVMDGALPAGMDEMDLESALRTGRLELQVVFRPEGAWRMKRKDAGGFYEGVKARFLAMRLVESRTGAEIASKILAN